MATESVLGAPTSGSTGPDNGLARTDFVNMIVQVSSILHSIQKKDERTLPRWPTTMLGLIVLEFFLKGQPKINIVLFECCSF